MYEIRNNFIHINKIKNQIFIKKLVLYQNLQWNINHNLLLFSCPSVL